MHLFSILIYLGSNIQSCSGAKKYLTTAKKVTLQPNRNKTNFKRIKTYIPLLQLKQKDSALNLPKKAVDILQRELAKQTDQLSCNCFHYTACIALLVFLFRSGMDIDGLA
jgi:hypothetical protein